MSAATCGCGCGRTVAEGSQFVRGHNFKTAEHRRLVSDLWSGREFTAEHKANLRRSLRELRRRVTA